MANMVKTAIRMPKEHFKAIAARFSNPDDELQPLLREKPSNTQITGLDIIAETADYARSMAALKRKGLRPLTYQEALSCLIRNSDQLEDLKGKTFWLERVLQLPPNGLFSVEDNGELKEGLSDVERTAYVIPGNGMLIMAVFAFDKSDADILPGSDFIPARFLLSTDSRDTVTAHVVLGAKI